MHREMIELSKDKKSGMYIITRTDSEGFHRQLSVSADELRDIAAMCQDYEGRLTCPLCGGELKWQSSVMACEQYPGAFEDDNTAMVAYYLCDRCDRTYEICNPNEEERKELKYWENERTEKTI